MSIGQRFEFNLLQNSCALFIVQPSLLRSHSAWQHSTILATVTPQSEEFKKTVMPIFTLHDVHLCWVLHFHLFKAVVALESWNWTPWKKDETESVNVMFSSMMHLNCLKGFFFLSCNCLLHIMIKVPKAMPQQAVLAKIVSHADLWC